MSEPCVEIERLAYGAHGVARRDGKVLFVRGTAPGDVVEVLIQEDHGSYAYASAERFIETSPTHRSTPCVYLPRCGGCPWQHITYEAQLRAKQENVADHLRRIGGIVAPPMLPIIASPREYGYRSRLSLRADAGRVGFYAAASHDLVEIERCLLGGEVLNAALPQVAQLVSRLRSNIRRAELIQSTVPDADTVSVLGEVEGQLDAADDATIASFIEGRHSVCGVVLHGKGWRRSWGDDGITIAPQEDLALSASSGAFTQVNPLGNLLLVNEVLKLSELAPSDRVLELYSGIGNLTFAMARQASHVTAVEQDRIAAQAAQDNARRLGVHNVEIIHASARRILSQRQRRSARFDAVVVDPPRSGISDIINLLLDLAPPRLIYVSCNPSTLARDLKRLAARYRLLAVQPIDLFPQTYHVEVVVSCRLTT